jgi:hypothetical protein
MLSIQPKEGQMTIKLTDSQLVILSAAAQRENHAVLPLPKSLKANGPAATRVLRSLIAKKLIEERPAGLDDEVWREDKEGARLMLAVAEAGLEAIGIMPEGEEPKTAKAEHRRARRTSESPKNGKASSPAKANAKAEAKPSPSKQAMIIDLLKRKDGVTIDELTVATGWQAHSVRGAISGALKKKLGLAVSSVRIDGRSRVYRIANAGRAGS